MSASAASAAGAASVVSADPSPAVPFAPSASVPFTQLVSFVAKDANSADHIVDLWGFATAHTVEKEKGLTTLSYEIYRPAQMPQEQDKPTEVFALETYASKLQLDTVHMAARPITDFISAASSLTSEPVGLRFLHPQEGFHSRGEAREAELRASGVKPHMLIATMDFASPAAAQRFLSVHARAVAEKVQAEEPGCLSYHFYLVTTERDASPATSTQVVVFERYVTVRDLSETHANSPYFKKLVADLAADKEAQPIGGFKLRHYTELAMGFIGDA
jgi:quinol monooxygenase YgiN